MVAGQNNTVLGRKSYDSVYQKSTRPRHYDNGDDNDDDDDSFPDFVIRVLSSSSLGYIPRYEKCNIGTCLQSKKR
eukprot:scaffold4286_cov92-Amphora_coffeaeformis.AAC.11